MQVVKLQNADTINEEYSKLLSELQDLRNALEELVVKFGQLQARYSQMQEVMNTISNKCTQDALDICKNAGTVSDLQAGIVDGLNAS